MTTATLEKIDVKVSDLYDLLTGSALMADRDKSRPSINGVYISASEGKLYVKATDRYRLIIGSVEYSGELPESLIPLDQIKRITDLLKPHNTITMQRSSSLPVTLSVADTYLTVDLLGSTLKISLADGKFPSVDAIVNITPVATSGISVNAKFLADFAKVPAVKSNQIKLLFQGDNKPVNVEILHDSINWMALLMPMRVK
jgi:DNA polymerase III sliding clamp (beta) subunit (PCNA family)